MDKKYKVSFFSMPRTGSGVLSNDLHGRNDIEIIRHYKLEEAVEQIAHADWVFAFVRNPYDRLVSAYNWVKSGGMHNPIDKASQEIINQYSSIDSFVDHLEEITQQHPCVHFYPMCWWITDIKHNPHLPQLLVDKVCCYEKITFEIASLVFNGKLPVRCLWGHIIRTKNVSFNYKTYEEFYESSDIRRKVYRFYQKDFELFGYSRCFSLIAKEGFHRFIKAKRRRAK